MQFQDKVDPTPLERLRRASAGDDPYRRQVRAALCALVGANMPVVLGANLTAVALMVVVLWEVAAGAWLLAWAGAVVAVAVGRYLGVRAMGRAAGEATARHQCLVITVGAGATGLVWSLSLPLVAATLSPPHEMFVALVVMGMAAGSLATTAAVLAAYVAFLTPIAVAITAELALRGGTVYLVLLILALLFVATLLITARHYHHTLARSLRLRFEKAALAEDLRHANRELQQEIAGHRQAQARLAESEATFRTLTEAIDCAIFLFRDRLLYVNPAGTELTGYGEEELKAMALAQLVHPQHREAVIQRARDCLAGQTPAGRCEFKIIGRDGATRWVTLVPGTITLHGQTAGLAAALDITARKQAEEALFREKERALVTLESIADGVVTTGIDGVVQQLNPVAAQLTGWTAEAARGQPATAVLRLVEESGGEALADPVRRCLQEQRPLRLSGDTLLITRGGQREYSVEVTVAPIRDRERQIIGAVVVLHDLTELRGLTRLMSHQARHDALTGLINRREFEARLEGAIRGARQHGLHHVLCYLDLDQFKVVNDTCGHLAGDELLRRLSHRLLAQIREADTLARLGGDEFGVLLEGCHLEAAQRVAEKLRNAVRSFRFFWGGRALEVGVSIGLVAITADSGELTDVLSAADSACYLAKDRGRNRVHVFTPDDPDLTRRHGEMRWMQRLREALAHDRLRLFCQPLGRVDGGPPARHGEILLRLLEEDGSLIPPGEFLPAAERYHLMPDIDRWVVRQTLQAIRRGHPPLGELATCSINLSGQSVSDAGFLDFIHQALAHSGVDPGRICFEITETAVIADLPHAIRFMETLRERGCQFALDDFGSGLSSFAYLKSLPVDYLKIDGVFVRNLAANAIDRAMVETINRMGHLLGLKTVAEYVENAGILEILAELKVDFAQGFAIAGPLPVAAEG
ncbi:MAG: EAL domain-containing protein [Pseudomonadota bacterium]|nr:EAL domain-containing protein [Pseudomonadota bacterium]